MTEDSFYWAGTDDGDAGPYAENTMWRNLAQVGIAGNAESDSDLYNIGVFYSVGNQLEVTLDGVNLDVDTGAALVDGAYYENDTSVDITVDAASAGDERIDYIVLRKCYSGSTYNPGGSVPSVGEQEVRITVIKGTEVTPPVVPSAPSLTQDTARATYWDIPLATVEVDDTGATSVTDAREYVDAETKQFFLTAIAGYNSTDGTEITLTATSENGFSPRIELPDTKLAYGMGQRFIVPKNYISDLTVTAVVSSVNSGNVYADYIILYGSCSEKANQHTNSGGPTAIAIFVSGTDPRNNCIAELSAASISSGDILRPEFRRDATDPLDTVTGTVFLQGWVVEYIGWKW